VNTAMETWPRPHRLTVEEYYRMAEVGLLAPDARVELIEGEIIDMAPIGTDHGSIVDQLTRLFVRAVDERAIVRVQGAVRLSSFTEPQPDLALLRPSPDFYRKKQPTGADSLLVIEVSDTTLRYDLKTKAPLYARLGVPEVWIFDVNREQIHFFRSPSDGSYGEVSVVDDPGVVELRTLPGVSIDLSRLWKAGNPQSSE